MIKNRAAALGFRVFMLGVGAYILVQTIITNKDWSSYLWQYPYVVLLMTLLILLLLVTQGITQIKKDGIAGLTGLTQRIRGAFVVASWLLLVYYLVLYRPSLVIQEYAVIEMFLYIGLPIFWVLDSLLFDERNKMKRFDPVVWLLIGVGGYVGAILIRASSSKQDNPYVYDALNVAKFGVAAVAKNVGVISVVFLLVAFLVYVSDSIGKPKMKK